MSRLEKPVVIGITGGSGSGKTTIAQKIVAQMQENELAFGQQFFAQW